VQYIVCCRKFCKDGIENFEPSRLQTIGESIELLSTKRKQRKRENKLSTEERETNPRTELLDYLKTLWYKLPKANSYKYFSHRYSLPNEDGFSYDDLLLKIADTVVKYVFCDSATVDISDKTYELPNAAGM